MTSSARKAKLASLTAIVVLSVTAVATVDANVTETAADRTVTATASANSNGAAVGAPDGDGDGHGLGIGDEVNVDVTGDTGSGDAGVGADPGDPGVASTAPAVDQPTAGGPGAAGGDAGVPPETNSGGAAHGNNPVVLVDDPEAGRRGLQALLTIDFPWEERLPGWRIRFREASQGAYGYTLTDEQQIEIYVRPDQSDALLAHVLAHELGHAVDVALNDGDDREAWREARGMAEQPWWPDDRAADFATGAGDFAECFAAAMLGPGSFRSEVGGPPSSEQVALILLLAEG
jgi:hypothetical protein